MRVTDRVIDISKARKYLGILLDWGALKKEMFTWLFAGVNMKLKSWKESLMSKARKEELIRWWYRRFLNTLSQLLKSMSICKAIEKKVAIFWWRNNIKSACLHLRNWKF